MYDWRRRFGSAVEKRRRWVAVAASWECLWRSMTSVGFEEAERERELKTETVREYVVIMC